MTTDDVLEFWFQQCRPWQWFRRRDSFDALLRDRFSALVERALADELEAWADTPSGGLGLVLLLDQFTRQIWRGEAKAFAGDQQAKALSHKALQQGWIQQEQERAKRQFWLMPLLHSEEHEVLVQAIPVLEQFADVATADVARRHLIQLQRFGRYPHRNAALGRVSSTEEALFVQQAQRRWLINLSAEVDCRESLGIVIAILSE